ncbi:MAG TPA: hypothetical protein PKX93_00090 [bacterium]|nr:hypothetical protein [bacterium]HOL65840.1 hypothetical protein [bacterium]HPP11110.1 hypothetical protein [bacterium]
MGGWSVPESHCLTPLIDAAANIRRPRISEATRLEIEMWLMGTLSAGLPATTARTLSFGVIFLDQQITDCYFR